MWLNKIKKRKMQYFIIMLLLLISTGILVACISFAWETQKFVDEYYDVEQSPVYYAILSQDNGKELLEESSEAMQLISKIDTGNAKIIVRDCFSKGEKLDNEEIMLYQLEDKSELGYNLQLSDGENSAGPGDDEIWICHVYADAVGLSLGDEISFGEKDGKAYKVTAIVNTPECNSGFLDNYPCYMNEETLNEVEGVEGYSVQIYAKNNKTTVKQIMAAFPQQFSDEIQYSIERDTLKMCLSLLSGIFGGVGIVSALLIFGVSIIVLRYLVRATIAKEYRMIGIYKSLGRSSKEVRTIYFRSYLVTGVLGIALGLGAARPLAMYLANMVLGGNEAFYLTYRTVIVAILCVVVMTLMLTLNLWLELRKINEITPIQALAMGTLSSKEKLCKSVVPNAHSALSMAVNSCFKNRGMTLLVILILSVSFYMNLLACTVGITLGNYAEDVTIWENLPEFDGYIKLNGEEEALDYIKNSEDVEDYVALNFSPNCAELEFEGNTLTVNNASPMVYDNFTKERYANVPFTKGRICVNPHEITCSEEFLEKAGKSVGDYLKLKIGENQIDFLIVGSYSAMMKGGTSFYILNQDMEELGVEVGLPTVLFFLKDGVTYEEFAKDFEDQFDTASIGEKFAFINHEGNTVTDIANPICIVIFFAFFSFSVLNVINLLYTQTRENRKKYGVLKALGFTTRYIRSESIIRITMESAIAILITIILQKFLSPILFSIFCGVKYTYSPLWLVVAVCSGMYAIILAITCLMLVPVGRISPVELMEE